MNSFDQTAYDYVTDAKTLEKMVGGIKNGSYDSLFIVGPGGTGKTTSVLKILGEYNPEDRNTKDGAVVVSGQCSAIQLYIAAAQNIGRPIVVDDGPELSKNPAMVLLLREMTDSRPVRSVSWNTSSNLLEKAGVERRFETNSPLVYITNHLEMSHDFSKALSTRSVIIRFEPSPQEIHSEAIKHGYDPVVVKFVEQSIKDGIVHRLNYRDYRLASARRKNNDPWISWLLAKFTPEKIDNLEDPSDILMAWARRSGHTSFALRDVQMNLKMFRENRPHLDRTVQEMVARGVLQMIQPQSKTMGRKRSPIYQIVDQKEPVTNRTTDNRSRSPKRVRRMEMMAMA